MIDSSFGITAEMAIAEVERRHRETVAFMDREEKKLNAALDAKAATIGRRFAVWSLVNLIWTLLLLIWSLR